MKYFELDQVSDQEIKKRFKPYNGVDDLPHRRNQIKTEDGMADYDFYLSWTPKQTKDEIFDQGVCKRYWYARTRRAYESESDDD
jgi:hypothetical protein